jgi:hypothetical protein
MAHKTRYEKGRELLAQAMQERDRRRRAIMERAAERYFNADIENPMNDNPDKTKEIILALICYLVIFLSVIVSFRFLAIYAAVLVIVGTFALLCVMMGAMLRIQGYLTEGGFLAMVREGFKALFLLRKT